jgi:hypothetical protein
MKSIERGNKVIGIHINAIKGKDQLTKADGPNPFDNLCLEISADGSRAKPTEWKDGKWIYYTDLESFAINRQPEENRGKTLRLSHWLPVYDWVSGEGYKNFSTWIA